jgi:hypothetical protein
MKVKFKIKRKMKTSQFLQLTDFVAKKKRKKIKDIQTNNYLVKILFIKSKTWYSPTKMKISMMNRLLRINVIQTNQTDLKKKN